MSDLFEPMTDKMARHSTSQALIPLTFPLYGSRLIEASAGTGKTWTIAALYVRLVLGHGVENAFNRPLMPAEILVMTFTRAATKELSSRIRERLVAAAACFSGEQMPHDNDPFLQQLLAAYPAGKPRQQAAYRLMMAAQCMDDAAVFTIDAWCQRMLREHAFDSGSLFNEELVVDLTTLFEHAVRDYWRQEVLALKLVELKNFSATYPQLSALEKSVKNLMPKVTSFTTPPNESLSALIERITSQQNAQLNVLKQGWLERINAMQEWVDAQMNGAINPFKANSFAAANVQKWFDALRQWVNVPDMVKPHFAEVIFTKFSPNGLRGVCKKNCVVEVPAEFEEIPHLAAALNDIESINYAIMQHAVIRINERIDTLKARANQFGFNDMLQRLKAALQGENGDALRRRMTQQYPIAMIDEFQDTSPDQYAIFDTLYQISANHQDLGLFLIGDPKQSIYGFRDADIYSYLAARHATTGRHYLLGTNFRSTKKVVAAVNAVFAYAETYAENSAENVNQNQSNQQRGFSAGAFGFRTETANPVPFEAVAANGKSDYLVTQFGEVAPLTFWCQANRERKKENRLAFFAERCAEHIVALLNDEQAGFFDAATNTFTRLQPADIALLVRDRTEANVVQQALQRRNVASVYLSDKDTVFDSQEALDLLRWLTAIANPTDIKLARTAYATNTAERRWSFLMRLAVDDSAWEECVEELAQLHRIWQRQGVLAMVRKWLHLLNLPALLLQQIGGERRLTNLLHLAEILQKASEQCDGEQALMRWFAEQMNDDALEGDDKVLRLESDAALVKICTIHKSKGLEYPLVYLPFATSVKAVKKPTGGFYTYTTKGGVQQVDLTLSDDAKAAVEQAQQEEDIRLLYVALTRARHAIWLGITPEKNSALGYLLTGQSALAGDQIVQYVQKIKQLCDDIAIEEQSDNDAVTLLVRQDQLPELIEPIHYQTQFERDWSVGRFSSITRAMIKPPSNINLPPQLNADEQQAESLSIGAESSLMLDVALAKSNDDTQIAMLELPLDKSLLNTADKNAPSNLAPWHHFPRGSRPGQFLHTQLEWIAAEGFEVINHPNFAARFNARCARAGWANRQEAALTWLTKIVSTKLKMVDVSLIDLQNYLCEMEFWYPTEHVKVQQLDALCRVHLLQSADVNLSDRPALPERQLHGLMMGFADLLFEHQGKYWVLDYKSTYLGETDAHYHHAALLNAMKTNRYDMQGAIYLLALHRLLKQRLGDKYAPSEHLGGALFLFMRGINHPETQGCFELKCDALWLEKLDQLFTGAAS